MQSTHSELDITFLDVEQQQGNVCSYFAIDNAVKALLSGRGCALLPPREDWKIDMPSTEVEQLLHTAMSSTECEAISRRVLMVDEVASFTKCCDVKLPQLRTAVDTFLEGWDVSLLVNCVDVEREVLLIR